MNRSLFHSLQNNNAEFKKELLTVGKESVKFGLSRYAIPLLLVFAIIDIIYSPVFFYKLLAIRAIMIPVTVLSIFYLQRINSSKQFQIFYFGITMVFAIAIYSMIVIASDPQNLYYTGLILVLAGGTTGFPMSRLYRLITSAFILFPFIFYSIFTKMFESEMLNFLVYNFVSFSLVFIFDTLGEFLNNSFAKEFTTRKSLENIINQRDSQITTLASELAELNVAQKATEIDIQNKEKYYNLAKQVAHDIRSPLSALNLASKKIADLSPDIGHIVESASQRINTITNEILKTAQESSLTNSKRKLVSPVLSLQALCEEKKFKTKSLHKEIEFTIHHENITQDIQIEFPHTDFSRVFSNLIDNSIDAISQKGQIQISLSKNSSSNTLTILIFDNGCGIPAEKLSSLGKYGFTYGKENGHGLGLAHAIKTVESYNGNVAIKSTVDQFTEIKITNLKICTD